jgi:hypothetical protein
MNEALRDNASVKELLATLGRNHAEAGDFWAVLGHVHAMERQLDAATVELREMRRELSAMREERNHPLRSALQKAVRALEAKTAEAREKLGEIKDAIVSGCKNAVSAFKKHGVAALANLAAFFRVGPLLQAMRKSLTEGVASNERAMRRIDAMSAEYHSAGLHLKNAGRALRGKEAATDVKPSGKLAKLAKSPFAAHNAQMRQALRSVNGAITGLERLNQNARRQTAEKPSILHTLDEMKERARMERPATPVTEAAKRRDMSL